MNTSGSQIRNLSQLSTEEIIHYIEAGIIENVPGEVVLKIVKQVQQKIEELEKEKENYDTGYDDAICEAIGKLERMRN